MRALLMMHVAIVALAAPVSAADLTLKRVMLSSAGVGYFEYEASVTGPASLGLDVPVGQVDDVLKSLVVFDGAGRVGSVELPGRDETHAAFGDVPFGPEGLASPLAFLNSLQGVDVSVEGPRPMQGRILRAESVREPGAGPGQEGRVLTRVTLLTASGLRQFVLEESESVQVVDQGLRTRIERAVAAARHESSQDERRVTITSRGEGPRTVRVSYVSLAPLWKASYRLVLPAEDAGKDAPKARLQGWATLENVSGTDWSQVSLALQYGNPVTFHQAIYRSYFVTRPEVPVEVLGRLLPDVDTRARITPPAPAASMPMPAPAPMMLGAVAGSANRAMRPAPQAAPMPPMAEVADSSAVQEGATETVFSLPNPIDLAAGHSASVPILDVQVPAQRIALAKPDDAHPLAAIRIANDSGSSLPAGVLTLYDAQADAPYAGDARLGGLPTGENRLISYAQDLRTDLEWQHEESTTLASLSASGGVLQVDQRERALTHVKVTAPAGTPRLVLIEVPKPDGGAVASGFARPTEETATAWRFTVKLKPGETQTLTYAIDQHERRSMALLDEADAVAEVLNLQGVSPAAKAALERIGGLRAKEADRTAERDRIAAQRTDVDKDEARLRANLGALQTGDALRTRLLKQLETDENRRAQLDAAFETANQAVIDAHRALTEAIGTLQL